MTIYRPTKSLQTLQLRSRIDSIQSSKGKTAEINFRHARRWNCHLIYSICVLFRPHRRTTYVDAACCYRWDRVPWSVVCLSATAVSPAKTAEPIEMPFELWTWVRRRKHVLHGGHIDTTWWIRLNRPCAAAMRPYVKLLWQLVIIRLHRSITCHAAYCYRLSSVVCRSLCLSVNLLVTPVSPTKTIAPIEMPFELRTRVGPGNHVLDGGPDPHGKGQYWGGKWRPM